MNLVDALELIQKDLPLKARDRILNSCDGAGEEYSGRGFSFWRRKRLLDHCEILERRLLHADAEDVQDWLRSQLQLLRAVGETGVLIQGYVVEDGHRYEFSIAPDLGRFVTYRSLL